MTPATLTAERLRELLHYDPDTGVFTWLTARHLGKPAGSPHAKGYVRIRIASRDYLAHRLAWLYVEGAWPGALVDHRDCNRANNRFGNLREATPRESACNRRVRSDSMSRMKGVAPNYGRFQARIKLHGRVVCLGQFNTSEEAHAAYSRAAETLHGSFARTQ